MPNSLKGKVLQTRGRSLWFSDNTADLSDVTVPIHLAYCQVVAALRHHACVGPPNLAIIVVPADAIDSFVSASRLYLRQILEQTGYIEPFVRALRNTKRDRLTEMEIQRRAAEAGKSILICATLDEVDEELRLFADVISVIPAPTPHQILATFRRYGCAITSADEEMIRSETWTRLVYAFQPNRPVKAALRRLRETAIQAPAPTVPTTSTGPTLADLSGLGAAKEWGLELARDLDDFKAGLIPWDDVDIGALISGPPGTGKTLFAEALARTCRIPIVVSSAAQWQASGYLNDMLKAMRESFNEARSKGTALLFIDELDAVGSRTMSSGHNADYTRQVINALLELLDGFERRSGMVVVGATNHPEFIDPAILRSGRLDKHFFISLPDATTRQQIFRFHAGFPVPDDDGDRFARSTTGMSGADLQQLVRDGRRAARRQGQPFDFGHVAAIVTELVDLPAEQMRRAAFHEAGHAIAGIELGMELQGITINDKVLAVGIDNLGGAAFTTPAFPMKTRSYFLDQICMLLAGLGAEALIFGEFTEASGDPSSDLARATVIATKVEGCFGMGATLAIDLVDERDLARLRAGDFRLRKAVTELLDVESTRAKRILEVRTDALNAVANALMKAQVLSATQVRDILRCYPAREDSLGLETDHADHAVRVARRAQHGLDADDICKEVDAALRKRGML